MNRNYVYAFPSVHGTCNVVNYSGSCHVNDFLRCFDEIDEACDVACNAIREKIEREKEKKE